MPSSAVQKKYAFPSASVVIGLAVAPWPVQAQDHHIVMPPDQVKFGPAPPALLPVHPAARAASGARCRDVPLYTLLAILLI